MLPSRESPEFCLVNEPFHQGRSAWRLFFDFGAMLSCFRPEISSPRVLDFACGTCWLSEWLNRMGFDVYAVDIEPAGKEAISLRGRFDRRIDEARLTYRQADGHRLPFADAYFSYICCFDSLHHMHDYARVFAEMYRVLAPGGRAIFVEPGAQHSRSKETIEFLEKYKKHDPDWIEKDVVLDDVNRIAKTVGFKSLTVRPLLWPQLREYDFETWGLFRAGNELLGKDYLSLLSDFNYNSRIIFYIQRD